MKPVVWLFIFLLFSGCGEYFDNPLIDKETGEDLNLLIIDFNFFTTSMTYKLLDVSDGLQIAKEAKVSFTGQNGDDIVTFAGKKREEFYTTEGQLELTIDPNVNVSAGSPIVFGITVEIDGYNVLTQGIQIQSEGKKIYELLLSKIEDENIVSGEIDFGAFANSTKSTEISNKPYSIVYTATAKDLLLCTGTGGSNDKLFSSIDEIVEVYNSYNSEGKVFFALTTEISDNYKPSIDVVSLNGINTSVMLLKMETGNITKIEIGGKEVKDLHGGKIKATCIYNEENVPENFGYARFNAESWELLGAVQYHETPMFEYTIITASSENICPTGASIIFKSDVVSSFSIDIDIEDLEGNFLTSTNFTGNFWEEFNFENVPDMPVNLVFRNNNPAFEPILPMRVNDLCSGNIKVDVQAKDGFKEYQIVLKAFCTDNSSIAIAPTYNAQFRLKNSDDVWQGITMEGGIVDLLGLTNEEYELRLYWDEDWEYSTYFTKFDEDGNYLGTPESGAKIESKIIKGGRIQISIEKIFSQNICDDLGW